MSVQAPRNQQNYSLNQPTTQHQFRPIIANRAPTSNDMAAFGQIWINKATLTIYMLAGTTNGAAQWKTSPASGLGSFTSVTVDPGNVHITSGNVTLDSGNVALTAGNMTIGGNLTVAGTTSLTGDIDFSSTALIDLISTLDAAPSILLHADGGTSEQIYLHSDQGTAVDSILLGSDVGGLTLLSGLASADAINITASSGGVDIDGALQVNIASSQNAGNAIVLSASAGGIDVLATGAAGEDIDIVNTGGSVNITATEDAAKAIYIRTNGGTSETLEIHADQGTGVASVYMHSDVGGVTISGGLATADAVNILSSDVGGGIDIDAGTAGLTIDSTGAISLDGAAASNFSVSGAGIDLTLASSAGTVIVNAGEDTAQAIYLHANGGTSETIQIHADQGTGAASVELLSDVGGITLTAGLASADAINIAAAAGGVDIDGALQVNIASSQNAADALVLSSSAGGIDITSAGAAGEDIDITASSSINLVSTENAAQSLYLHANGGTSETIDILASQGTGVASVNVHSTAGGVTVAGGLASANAVNLTSSNAAGGMTFSAGTAGIAATSTGAVALTGGADSSFSVTGANVDITLNSAGGQIIIGSQDNAASAIYLHANGGTSETINIYADQGTGNSSINIHSDVGGVALASGLATANAINMTASDTAGGITATSGTGGFVVSSTGAVSLDGQTASHMTVTGSADLTLSSTAGSVNVVGGEAAADAIYLHASNAGGGVTLTAGTLGFIINTSGVLSAVDATATSASPTAALAINANLGTATFTGFTTAAGSSQVFTINNSLVATTSGVLVTVTNLGSNDAQMTMTRVQQTAGAILVTTKNNGAAALNGNVVISFWVYRP